MSILSTNLSEVADAVNSILLNPAVHIAALRIELRFNHSLHLTMVTAHANLQRAPKLCIICDSINGSHINVSLPIQSDPPRQFTCAIFDTFKTLLAIPRYSQWTKI